jgi:hypothetical protein
MSKVVLRALDLIGNHLRTHKSGGGADAPLDLAKRAITQRMDNPAPAAPPVAEKGNTTQGSVFAKKKEFELPEIRPSSDDPHEVADANFTYSKVHGHALLPIEKVSGGVDLSQPDQRRRIDALKEHISHPERGHISRLIVDTEGNVVEGQHRFEALKELGAKHIPAHVIEDIGRGVDEDKMKKAIKEAGPISSDHVNQIAHMALESVGDSGSPAKAREEWEAPRGFEPHWHAALDHLEEVRKAGGGEVEGYSKGGGSSIEDAELQRRMQMLLHPEHEDPAMVQRYFRAQESYEVPTHERGAYSARVLPMAAHDVATKIKPLGNAVPQQGQNMSWHEFHKIGKGGTLFTLGGDRSNLGRLTHINGEKLAWPVDLHAGTKYMAEPNEGAVWANAAGAASALQNNIREAAKKGPVFGTFAPMGPKSVDSSVNMFDALMAQVPKSGISAETAKAIDDSLKAGAHIKGTEPEDIAKRDKAKQIMEKWPGILNAKKTRDFATGLSGEHRSAIVKHLESAPFQKEGFPSVGITRAAITDPDLLGVSGNMMGHHIVELHEGDYDPKNLAFEHSTYPVPTKGKFLGKIPLIERHIAQPDFTEQQIMHPSVLKATGEPTIIHPYSPNAQGRSSYRGNTEMRQGIQPINERMLESIEEKHGSSFAKGGTAKAHPASIIPGVHIVGHNPIFHGDE